MTEEVVIEKEAIEEPVLSDVEQRAVEMGWMPKEKWVEAGNDAAKHRSAELFVELEPLFGKIESLKKEGRQTKQALEALKLHHAKVREVEYERALADLKAQKRIALEDGDAASVVEIDEEIAETKTKIAQERTNLVREQAQEIHPEFAEWVAENAWYATDNEMQVFADGFGQAYTRKNPGVPPKEVLAQVEKAVKKAYPDKFKNPARSQPSGVEAPRQAAKGAAPKMELTEDERRVMTRLVKQGVMTEAEYIADLKKLQR